MNNDPICIAFKVQEQTDWSDGEFRNTLILLLKKWNGLSACAHIYIKITEAGHVSSRSRLPIDSLQNRGARLTELARGTKGSNYRPGKKDKEQKSFRGCWTRSGESSKIDDDLELPIHENTCENID